MKRNLLRRTGAPSKKPILRQPDFVPRRLRRWISAARLLLIPLLMVTAVQAQFNYTTNNGTLTITGYTGPGGDVSIPSTIDVGGVNLPVTGIGDSAFHYFALTSVTIPSGVTSIGNGAFYMCTFLTSVTIVGKGLTSIGADAFSICTNLTSITIPSSLTSIGDGAFSYCARLTSVMIPNSVTNIGYSAFQFCAGLTNVTIPTSLTNIANLAFYDCTSLTSITIPASVTSIGDWAFSWCTGLTSVTIPNSVTSIGTNAFAYCSHLTGVYFQGDAPGSDSSVFSGDNNVTVYYLPGTMGWGSNFGGRPTAPWFLPNPLILNFGPSFGVRTNVFGFIISWATNASVAVEARTNLANPIWSAVGTNTLTSGSSYFSDPQWTNYPGRFYRLRSP